MRAGLALAGATDTVWLWIVALVLTGTGIGLGNTKARLEHLYGTDHAFSAQGGADGVGRRVVLDLGIRAVDGRFDVDYHSVDQVDWTAQLNGWLQQSAQRRGFF